MMQETQQDILTGNEYSLVQASNGKRFWNYFIDIVVFYLLAILFGIIMALVSPSFINSLNDDPGIGILDRIISLVAYGIYMGIMEALTKGRSVGKLITGTKAVNQDGTVITGLTAFKRGLSRSVPFEAFSALGSPSFPWHDKWTDTYVIDIKQSNL